MCNLYTLRVTRAELTAYYQANDAFRRDMEKDYVSPGRPGAVVTATDGDGILAQLARISLF